MAISKNAGVHVAHAKIERALVKNERDALFLLLKPGRGQWASTGNPATMEAFEAAVLHANDSTPEESAEALFTAPTPKGPVAYLDPPGDTPSETQTWLEAFAAHLTSAGVVGIVDLAPQDGGPEWLCSRRAQPVLTAFHAYRQMTPFPAGQPKPWTPVWGVEPTTTDILFRDAVHWCAEISDAQSYLSQGLSEIRFEGPNTAKILAATMQSPTAGTAAVTYAREHPLAIHRFELTWWGQAVFQIDGEPPGWRDRLEILTRTLLIRSGDLDLAIVRRTLPTAVGWTALGGQNPPLPYVDEIDVELNRHLWHRYTPDAHGIQILTDEHLDRANDLSGWDITAVAPGRHLVQAKDLTPWYSGSAPDPTTVEAARQDFGSMILTRDIIAAET